ncbi:MAG: nucleoside hydrolase [Bacillota bacterium]
MEKHRLIIDTDPGVDDTHALAYALLNPAFIVEGITTVFGNVPVETATRNAAWILKLFGRETIPLFQGAAKPLLGVPRYAPRVHGPEGLGDFTPPPIVPNVSGRAVDFIIDTVMANPGEITLVALGPLTNIALAVSVEPRVVTNVRRFVTMGGAIAVPGNASAVATANISNDPEAAQIVYRSGLPLTMVGLDVTRRMRISAAWLKNLDREDWPIGRFLYQISLFYLRSYEEREKQKGFPCHDLVAMACVDRPSLFTTRALHVDIETTGALARGQTIGDLRWWSDAKPNADVCWDVQGEALLRAYDAMLASTKVVKAS